MKETRKAVRMSLRDAEAELGTHRDTISKRLLQLGEKQGVDGLWSLRQICAAVFIDKEHERARLAKGQADRVELDNAERKRLLVPVEDALKLARKFTFATVGVIRRNERLTTEEKNAVIAEIRGLAATDFSVMPDDEI